MLVNCDKHSVLVAIGELLWSCLGFMEVPDQYKKQGLKLILHTAFRSGLQLPFIV